MGISDRAKRWSDNPTNVIEPDVFAARKSRERQADRLLKLMGVIEANPKGMSPETLLRSIAAQSNINIKEVGE